MSHRKKTVWSSRLLDVLEEKGRRLFHPLKRLGDGRWERRLTHTGIGRCLCEPPTHHCAAFRMRRRVMRWREEALPFRLIREMHAVLLRTSLRSYGLFLFLYAAFSVCFSVLSGNIRLYSPALWWAVGCMVSSAFLIRSTESCAYALSGSRLCGWIPVVLAMGDGELREAHVGEEHPWWALGCGLLVGLLSGVLTALWLPLLLAVYLLLMLAVTVPELLFLVAVAGVPLFHLFTHTTVWIAWLVLVGLLLWLFKLVGGRRFFSWGVPELLSVLFAGTYALNAFVGTEGKGGLREAAVRVLFLVAVIPLSSILCNRTWRRRFHWAVVLGGAAVGGVGVMEFLLGKARLQWVDLSRFSDIGGRVTVSFSNPNVLSVYLLAVLPFAFVLLLDASERPFVRMLGGAAFILEGLALLWTWTRGAWLGAVLSVVWMLLLYSDRSRAWLLFLPCPTLVCALQLPSNVLRRFESIFIRGDSSIQYRLYTWIGGFRAIAAHPYGIGIGEEIFERVFPKYAVSGTERVVHLHSLPLQVALEVGIVGAVLLFAILFFTLARCKSEDGRGIAGAAALVGMMTLGLFDYIWYDRGMMLLWSVAVGFCANGKEGEIGYEEF